MPTLVLFDGVAPDQEAMDRVVGLVSYQVLRDGAMLAGLIQKAFEHQGGYHTTRTLPRDDPANRTHVPIGRCIGDRDIKERATLYRESLADVA